MRGKIGAGYAWIRDRLRVPEWFFLFVFVGFGLLFLVLIPPFQVADESSHFFRAYQMTQGEFVSKQTPVGVGGELPRGVYDFAVSSNQFGLSFHPERRYFPRSQLPELWRFTSKGPKAPVRFVNTALYAPTNYVVPALGIGLAKLVTSKVIIQFYAGRLFNLAFYGACLFLAIRLIPRGKWILAALAILPMSLNEAASLSADIYLIGMVSLFVAYWFRLYEKPVLTIQNYLLLGGLGVLVALSKQSYVVLIPILLLLALPVRKNRAELKRRLVFAVSAGLATGLIAGVWMIFSARFNADFAYWAGLNGIAVKPPAAIHAILTHPHWFAEAMWNSLLTNNANTTVWSFFGMFGWLDTAIPYPLMIFIAITLFLIYGLADERAKGTYAMGRIVNWGFLALSLLFVAGLGVVLYAYWTPFGARSVAGLQGRYFIPLLIFLIPVMHGRYRHTIPKRYVLGGLVAALVCCTVVLACRYYTNPPAPAQAALPAKTEVRYV
jgi:uncharacterized membrane protein